MKKVIIILLALSLLNGCRDSKEVNNIQTKTTTEEAKKQSLNVNYNKDKIDFIENDSIENVDIGGNNMFSFKFFTDEDRFHLIKINIYKDDTIFQTIDTNKECFDIKYQLIDWNFDGY